MNVQAGIAMFAAVLMTGCVTLSGNYKLQAIDQQGKPVATNMNFTAAGRGVYTVRNVFCSSYPKATVFITSIDTGQNLDGESPYHCH